MPLLNTYERNGSDKLDELKEFIKTQVGILVGISGHLPGKNLLVFRNDGMEAGELFYDQGDETPPLPADGDKLVCCGDVFIHGQLKYLTISRR